MDLTEEALEKKREYYRQYRQRNRERYNEIARNWRSKSENKMKIKQYNKLYYKTKVKGERGVEAYEENGLFLYDDSIKKILITYDLISNTANGFNDRGDVVDLTEFFTSKPSLEEFSNVASQILNENPFLLG